jgi:hypothetical protein
VNEFDLEIENTFKLDNNGKEIELGNPYNDESDVELSDDENENEEKIFPEMELNNEEEEDIEEYD